MYCFLSVCFRHDGRKQGKVLYRGFTFGCDLLYYVIK